MQHISARGLKLLVEFEGYRGWVYKDPAGLDTIGYGHRVLPGESFPDGVTPEQAHVLLEDDVTLAEEWVRRLVHVTLTQGQFDALVDFVFNLGAGRLAHSTLLKELNEYHYGEALEQLALWDHAGNKVLPGLKSRREAEMDIWRTPPPSTIQAA